VHFAGVQVGDSLERNNDSLVGVFSIHLKCEDKARTILAGTVESDQSDTDAE
jgi:hypothetical protein